MSLTLNLHALGKKSGNRLAPPLPGAPKANPGPKPSHKMKSLFWDKVSSLSHQHLSSEPYGLTIGPLYKHSKTQNIMAISAYEDSKKGRSEPN